MAVFIEDWYYSDAEGNMVPVNFTNDFICGVIDGNRICARINNRSGQGISLLYDGIIIQTNIREQDMNEGYRRKNRKEAFWKE